MPIFSGGECFFRNEIKYSRPPLSNITLVFQSHSIAILCLCTVAAIIAAAKRMLLILSSSNMAVTFLLSKFGGGGRGGCQAGRGWLGDLGGGSTTDGNDDDVHGCNDLSILQQ